MRQHNPCHPGEIIREVYMKELGLSVRKLAGMLEVDPSTLSRLTSCRSAVSPNMAIRLSQVLGRSPESWLALQDNYSLWEEKNREDAPHLSRFTPVVTS